MTDTAKAIILTRLADKGYSGSYGALVYTAALLAAPKLPESANEEELWEWRGYFKGMLSALACVAMHEKEATPEQAAAQVRRDLRAALANLNCSGTADPDRSDTAE